MSPIPLVLGVDGGGSNVRAWLAGANEPCDAPPIAIGTAGSANANSVGIERAKENIRSAIEQALNKAPDATIESACLGLAGAADPAIVDELSEWARTKFARHVVVTHDAEIVLAAATDRKEGVVLLAGSGRYAWTRTADGSTYRQGGWGPWVGDDGSGLSIGRDTMRIATKAVAQRQSNSPLLDAIFEELAIELPANANWEARQKTLRTQCASSAQVAALAPLTFRLWSEGDSQAEQIILANLDALSEMAAGSIQWLHGHTEPERSKVTLALAGSLLTRQPRYRELLVDRLNSDERLRGWFEPSVVNEPVRGAVQIARERLRSR